MEISRHVYLPTRVENEPIRVPVNIDVYKIIVQARTNDIFKDTIVRLEISEWFIVDVRARRLYFEN